VYFLPSFANRSACPQILADRIGDFPHVPSFFGGLQTQFYFEVDQAAYIKNYYKQVIRQKL